MNNVNTRISNLIEVATIAIKKADLIVQNRLSDRADGFVKEFQEASALFKSVSDSFVLAEPGPLAGFAPVNGMVCIRRVAAVDPVWEILSMAPNCNLGHYPLAVGDLVIPHGGWYGRGTPGVLNFIKPSDILAVKRPA
jgi:hypothetical protein